MGRRIELANAADGMTGHFVNEADWQKDYILGSLARSAVDSEAWTIAFDFEGPDREQTVEARILRADLLRHLERRRIPADWVAEATLDLWLQSIRGRRARVRCRISIADDLGRVHTSTRSATVWMPRFGLLSRLARRFLAGR